MLSNEKNGDAMAKKVAACDEKCRHRSEGVQKRCKRSSVTCFDMCAKGVNFDMCAKGVNFDVCAKGVNNLNGRCVSVSVRVDKQTMPH